MKTVLEKTALVCGFFLLSCLQTAAQDPNFHIYLCFGQSNMCGAGTIEAQDQTVDSRFQVMYPMIGCSMQNRSFGKWYTAVPPLWGCPNGGLGPADYFGRTMVEKLPSPIKVGVIVVAVPGCDIRLFDKTGYQGFDTYNYVPSKYNGSAYAWLMELANLAVKDGVIKGLLMHQGETMPDSTKWPGQVKRVYDSLVADLKLPSTTPLLVGEVLYTSAGGESGGHNATIDTISRVIHDAYVISAAGLAGKDQWHFNSASERTFGARYAEKMLTLLEPVTTRDTEIPVPFRRGGFSETNPVVVTAHAVRITLDGEFGYGIFTIHGALVRAGNGTDAVSAGADLPAGMYFLAIRNKSCFFTRNFFKR